MSAPPIDIAIVGAGAAGLTAAIFAGEAAAGRGLRIVLLDGARKPGAKILVSGGGRCNVTNERVTPDDFWGGARGTIKKVLKSFDHRRTLEWMASLGVELKLEPTGKYFPASDSARTVLGALLRRAEEVGVELRPGHRVGHIGREAGGGWSLGFRDGEHPPLSARRLILATGGMSLPKSGSDGWGLAAARRLGHTITATTPALAPLVLGPQAGAGGRFADLSGLTLDVRLGVYEASGRRLEERAGSLLFTHFGVSGPAALDLSRHLLQAREADPRAELVVGLGHPHFPTPEAADGWLRDQAAAHPKRTLANALRAIYPERLASALAEGRDGVLAELSKTTRRATATDIARLPLNVTGSRGYTFAETTAGGVDLSEIDPRTMASRVAEGLYLCGEMLDVDGRIGGFNFQWAWASGHLAGRGVVGESD
ncbi:MAG: aminoacetone oxidase family FAD-binding enzyme [Sumerlaeia bacterium]